jgi:nitrate reductase NapAB chaperone NapD
MPILGMVLVLDDPKPATRRAVARALEHAPDLVLGEPADHRWPVVLESPDEHRAESRIDGLRRIPGIAGVDVVYADFEDLLERRSSPDAREES